MQTRIFGTERGAVPYLNLSFALLEQAVRRSRAAAPEATRVPFFNLGGGQTLDAKVSKLGADSLIDGDRQRGVPSQGGCARGGCSAERFRRSSWWRSG